MAQTVEILAGMQRENERHFDEVAHRFDQVTYKFDQVTHNFEIVLDSIKRLENIAMAHEQRLDRIEDQPQ